ncbi:MAG: hypothetical protein IPG34_17905 [Rhodocyclaceae bacterium]|nr:hypothetical protein [Rhodocyclaceae bacterium]
MDTALFLGRPATDLPTRFHQEPKLKLVGRYWTERLTKGEIVLQYHSKELLEELPEELGEHPITENENRR